MIKKPLDQAVIDRHIITLGKRLKSCIQSVKNVGTKSKNNMNEQAKELGIQPGTLSRYQYDDEDGVKMVMGVDKLVRIALYYNKSADYLLGLSQYERTIRTQGDALIDEICRYTGLSRQAVEALHESRNDNLKSQTINFLLEDDLDGIGILDDLTDYSCSGLWDDLAKDERYNTLPGSIDSFALSKGISTAKYKRRESLVCLMDKLPEFASALHDNKLSVDTETQQRIVADFAHSKISREHIITILYPDRFGIKTMQEAQEMERKLTEIYSHDLPDFKGGFIPVTFIDPESYEDDCAIPLSMVNESRSHHREQGFNFLLESFRRKDNG